MTPEERHNAILNAVLTYGVTTAAWIYPALYEGLTIHSADKDLQTLRNEGLLRSFRDANRTTYCLPTEKLCALRGLHRSFGRTGGEVSVARRVGVAAHCIRYGLTQYSASQFKENFPALVPNGGACGHYYVDHSEEPAQFGWIEVDVNLKGDVRRLFKKVDRIFNNRARIPAWAALFEAGQFHLMIVTPSEGKKAVIETGFAKRKPFLGPVYVEVAPELQPILLQETRPWR